MQRRAARLLFSNLSRNLSRSPTATNFSRLMSDGGRRRSDDPSEGHFLRSLNFGDGGRDDETVRRTHQDHHVQMPGRPLRGEQRPPGMVQREASSGGTSGDLFPELVAKNQNLGSGTLLPIPNRPMRGEMRGPPVKKDDGLDGNLSSGTEDKSFSATLLQKLKLGDGGSDKKVEEGRQASGFQIHQSGSRVTETPPQDEDAIFMKMKETGLIPNAVAMLDGLCKDGLVQDAMKLFGLMREKGTIPEVVIYTAVAEGFCKVAKFDDAKRIFRKMQNNGILPNAYSYELMIQGLCKGRKLEDAIEFCREMLNAGHYPNAATFIGLVDGLCTEKGLEEAGNIVKSLQEGGFVVDDKAVREYLDKKGPFSTMVWEAIFGKKKPQRPF